jgi:cell division protein ZapA
MGSTEVYILGQKYTIKGDAPEEYIQELAAYVDKKLKDVHNSVPNITPVKASILAALDLADELFQLKNQQEEVARHIEEKTDRLTALFDL